MALIYVSKLTKSLYTEIKDDMEEMEILMVD